MTGECKIDLVQRLANARDWLERHYIAGQRSIGIVISEEIIMRLLIESMMALLASIPAEK